MTPLSFYSQFETNLLSNQKVIELLLQVLFAVRVGSSYLAKSSAKNK